MPFKTRRSVLARKTILLVLLTATWASGESLRELTPLPVESDIPAQHEGYKSIPLHVTESAGVQRKVHPVRGGVPFPKGELTDWKKLHLVDDQGNAVPAQFDVLSRWWDFSRRRGEPSQYSIRWLAVSFLADFEPNQQRVFRLRYGNFDEVIEKAIDVRQTAEELVIDTGTLRATFDQKCGLLTQIARRTPSGWQKMLRAPAELFAELKGYPPTEGGLWTTLKPLGGPRQWRFITDADGVGEHVGFHEPDYDDRSWSWQNPFEPWEMQGFSKHDGDGWYRIRFAADQSWRDRAVYLEMRHQQWYGMAEDRKLWVYLNGEQIGTVVQRGKVDPVGDPTWKQVRVRLPTAHLRVDAPNVIAVRAYDGGDGTGGLLCTPLIVSPHDTARDGAYPDPTGHYDNLHGESALLTVKCPGPQRVAIEVAGWLHNTSGASMMEYRLTYVFHHGSALMDVDYTFTNTEDPYLVRVQSAGLTLPLVADGDMTAICAAGTENSQKLLMPASHSRLVLHQFHNGEGRYPGYPALDKIPFKPTWEVRSDDGNVLARGEKSEGWMSISSKVGSASVAMRDFWRDYPSQLAVHGDGRLTAYMWPDAGPEMDLRMWIDRRDGGWSQLEADVKAGELAAQSIKGQARNDQSSGDKISWGNAIGVSWTRRLRFSFHDESVDALSLQNQAVAWGQPIYPFVSAQWNCASEAVGVPMHPYDPTNYPILEAGVESYLGLLRKMHLEWLNVYGMFHYGAMRYGYKPGSETARAAITLNWYRRWYHQESGKSPSMGSLIQYMRTGHKPHLDFGSVIARFGAEVAIPTFHRVPQRTGYARRHRYTVFGRTNGSHTNIEGMILYYCLTGDERMRAKLDELNEQYQREVIHQFTNKYLGAYGRTWLNREHDGPLLCRLLLWQLDGADWQRDWVLNALDFYRHNDMAGFTNAGGASYRVQHMTRMWLRTRDPQFLELMADPIPWFVNGSKNELMQIHHSTRLYFTDSLPFLKHSQTLTREQVLDALEPHHAGRVRPASLRYPGYRLAAFYRSGMPTFDRQSNQSSHLVKYHNRLGDVEPYAIAKDHHFEHIDLRGVANADPFAIVEADERRWPWFGQYHTYNDQSPRFDATLKPGQIGWDFGPVQYTAEGWRRAYARAVWPTFEGYETSSNFIGYPFGATTSLLGVPFDLIDPATNAGSGYVRTQIGKAVSIPVGHQAARLFFLGHVLNGDDKHNAAMVGRYRVRYADGKVTTVTLQEGVHCDAWRNTGPLAALARPVPFARVWSRAYRYGPFIYNAGYLHLNVFALETDATRRIESVELESLDDGFCLMAITAEIPGAPGGRESQLVYESQTDGDIGFGEPLTVEIPNGWYDVTVDLPTLKVAASSYRESDVQVYIQAQEAMAVPGFASKFGRGLTFPVQVTDGQLSMTVHANRHKPTTRAIESVSVVRRDSSPGWVTKRHRIQNIHQYGWLKDPNNAGESSGEGLTDYPRRDPVTRDLVNAADNTFTAAVPNGDYRLTLLVMTPMGHPAFAPTVNGRRLKPTVLPRQRWAYGDPRVSRAYETIETHVAVTDGRIEVSFPSGITGYKWGKMIGLRGMILTPVSDAVVAMDRGPTAPTNDQWELRFEDTFDRDTLGDNWQLVKGSWQVKSGAITGRGILMCKKQFPGSQRIEYQCRSNSPCDLTAILSADWSGVASGYFVGFGSDNNAFSKLLIAGKEAKRWDAIVTPGKLHTVIVERDGNLLRQWIDGKLVMTHTHRDPLRNPMVGLYAHTEGTFEDIKVYTKRDR